MSEPVSSDTIDSLAGKLAAFAETLDDAERNALDQFFLQQSDVEGFMVANPMGNPLGSPSSNPLGGPPAGSMAGRALAAKGGRQQYYQVTLSNCMISN